MPDPVADRGPLRGAYPAFCLYNGEPTWLLIIHKGLIICDSCGCEVSDDLREVTR